MPTGAGKTHAFAALASELAGPTLVVVHRDELLQQSVATFGEVWPGAAVGTLPGKGWEQAQVVVATVQSLHRKLDQFPPDRFGLVVIDEAHHTAARIWQKVVGHFTPRLLLGCTATPERLDGRDLEEFFGKPLFSYPLGRAMEEGYLVPLRQYAVRTDISLGKVRVRMGEFLLKDLARVVAVEARNKAIVEARQRFAADRPTLVFAVDLAHVEQLRQAFVVAGVSAESVTGKKPLARRREVLAGFREGRYEVMVGCEVLTEGYDEQRIGCVIMARPTRSRALYQQSVGRGLRVFPKGGKVDCLFLDVLDRPGLYHPLTAGSLFGGHVEDCGGQDVRAAVEQERKLLEVSPLRRTATQAARLVSGEDTPWPRLPDLGDYAARYAWQMKPATEKQLKALGRFGLEALRPLTRGEASHLIDECNRLDEEYPTQATPGQRAMLMAHGLWRSGIGKREAQRLIAKLMLGVA
jgi:hypothetical protein